MSKIEVALGIDIGGTNTVFGLVDREGNKKLTDSITTNSSEPAEKLFNRIYEQLNAHNLDEFEIKGVGIGAPNANYFRGSVENPPNLEWDDTNVVEVSRQYLEVPTVCTNDANAAALGELKFGAAKEMKNFIEITLGTGLGSGIIVNGDVLYGATGFAGELGHVTAVSGGRDCGCGRRGCLETYASATGIVRTVSELLGDSREKSVLREIPFKELSAKRIADEARNGDKIALEAFDYTGLVLGEALANAVAAFSCEAIVLFGGLALAGDLLFEPTQRYMDEHMLEIFKNTCQLLPSKLPSGDAAILGASALIWNEIDLGKV
ncbi:MAG: ROK family protein [Melioribacteraceae bacterium]|nr:ROK family protein [Melioribacteraceae bacterium]MCF8264516.1 ROK family protein [Melioribacteraceae bacterium]MCF8412482.1 ROK family protein [Melioribacteraceae bacterium]